MTQAEWMKWLENEASFYESEAGRKVLHAQHRYVLLFEKDGSFKIDDVMPGTYELRIHISDPSKPIPGAPVGLHSTTAMLTKEVTLPELPEGEDSASYDLGMIELKPVSK